MLSRGRFVETGSLPIGSLNEMNVSLLSKVPSNNCYCWESDNEEGRTIWAGPTDPGSLSKGAPVITHPAQIRITVLMIVPNSSRSA